MNLLGRLRDAGDALGDWLGGAIRDDAAGADAAVADDADTGGIPREVLRQVRRIELRTRGVVDAVFSGEYHSVFRGQGMEFAEVREYQFGDDVRTIDWNVTARMRDPYVKKHVEERELSVMLAVDLSGSEQFATRGRFKAELAAEIAAVLALSAVRNNDRVGLLLFTDRIEHVVPPKKGRRHALRLIRDLLVTRPQGRGTALPAALEFATRVLPHRSIVFVLSDFIVPGAAGDSASVDPESALRLSGLERTARVVARRHDLVAIRIADEVEERLPDLGLVRMRDPETGAVVAVDTGDRALRARYGAAVERERQAMIRLFRRLGVDEIPVRTGESYIKPLLAFFERRERQQAR